MFNQDEKSWKYQSQVLLSKQTQVIQTPLQSVIVTL